MEMAGTGIVWAYGARGAYRRLKAEGVEATMPLHQHILATWKRDSPKMWAELKKAEPAIADKLTFIQPDRMCPRGPVVHSPPNRRNARG
jgi:hypothetical protein